MKQRTGENAGIKSWQRCVSQPPSLQYAVLPRLGNQPPPESCRHLSRLKPLPKESSLIFLLSRVIWTSARTPALISPLPQRHSRAALASSQTTGILHMHICLCKFILPIWQLPHPNVSFHFRFQSSHRRFPRMQRKKGYLLQRHLLLLHLLLHHPFHQHQKQCLNQRKRCTRLRLAKGRSRRTGCTHSLTRWRAT